MTRPPIEPRPARTRVPLKGDLVAVPGEFHLRSIGGTYVHELSAPHHFRVALDDGRRCTVTWQAPQGVEAQIWVARRLTPAVVVT